MKISVALLLLLVISHGTNGGIFDAFKKVKTHLQKSIKDLHGMVLRCGLVTWCSHPNSDLSWVDCDRDGKPDAVCTDTQGNFGYISMGKDKCPSSWPNAQCNHQKGRVCRRPKNWCVHGGATFIYQDCDGDGIPDPTCSDTQGNFGVVKSSQGCSAEWPNAKCDNDRIGSLVRKWGPQVRFHPKEEWMPSGVDYFLAHVNVYNGPNPQPLTASNLPRCSGSCFLETKKRISCPSCTEPAVLKGVYPLFAPTYAIVNQHSGNIMDIYYWFFFPYNRGKRVCMGVMANNVCPSIEIAGHCTLPRIRGCIGGYSTFGHHVGDWEHVIVRLKNYKPYSAYLSIHDSDITKKFGGEFLWDGKAFKKGGKTLQMWGTHMVVYSAQGSHGIWPDAGRHVYKTLPNFDTLVDYTGQGFKWNTWKYTKWVNYRRDQKYTGNFKWLQFMGKWGNREAGCGIAKKVSGECQLNGGPGGPHRGFMADGKLG